MMGVHSDADGVSVSTARADSLTAAIAKATGADQ